MQLPPLIKLKVFKAVNPSTSTIQEIQSFNPPRDHYINPFHVKYVTTSEAGSTIVALEGDTFLFSKEIFNYK